MHAVDSYVLLLQVGVQTEHMRFEAGVHAADSYVPLPQGDVQLLHTRPVVAVHAVVSYESDGHEMHGEH